MKRFLTLILGLVMAVSAFAFTACGNGEENGSTTNINVYVPDGAPALSVARLSYDKTILPNVNINVVSSNVITTYVTGEKPKADVCIMPVNAASKLLGTGQVYVMLGVVTHGNLFLMKKTGEPDITTENLSYLVGKTVGVINLANVPGLTFKAILQANDLDFVDITATGNVQTDKVNLKALNDGQQVVPNSDCDYFVVPEPAATTKQNGTGGAISIAGSLQELYGSENGYPQAVMVVKKSVLEDNASLVNALVEQMDANAEWLSDANTSMNDILSAVTGAFVDKDTSPTFTANNLNAQVIANCAIKFDDSSSVINSVKEYLTKINAVSENAWGTPASSFFYIGQ